MRQYGLQLWHLAAVLFGQLATAESHATITSSTISSAYASSSLTTTSPTCSSTTFNYITHNLPQQCLRTNWSPSSSVSVSAEALVSASASRTAHANEAILATSIVPPAQGQYHDEKAASLPASNVSESIPESSQSAPTSSSQGVESATPSDSDLDSPLDDAKFLSFEEWKKQNLAQAEALRDEKAQTEVVEGQNHDRTSPGFNNALEAMGDEGKIDIDMSGFGGVLKPVQDQVPSKTESSITTSDSAEGDGQQRPPSRNLPKEAGKTHKERSNYASFDCGAKILKTNPRCKSATSVLSENKDSYMLHECSVDNKFFIVELCDEILIDTVVLANFEFFSSIFRTFRVSVSNKYPVRIDKWITLGTYEARNVRGIQAFLVEKSIWSRFFRIEFLTHYGSEYYCPLSLLRVHGMTEREDLRRSLNNEPDDDDVDLDEPIVEVPKDRAIAPLKETAVTGGTESVTVVEEAKALVVVPTEDLLAPSNNRQVHEACPTNMSDRSPRMPSSAWSFDMNSTTSSVTSPHTQTCAANHTVAQPRTSVPPSQTTAISSVMNKEKTTTPRAIKTSEISVSSTTTTSISHVASSMNTSLTNSISPSSGAASPASIITPEAPTRSSATSIVYSSTTTLTTTSTTFKTHTNTVPSSAAPPPSNNPVNNADSFFMSTNKRLQSLESSATLSLQYIESQSRLLRDAFNTVSSRQLNRTTAFLSALNTTVTQELLTFRTQYDQLWQSTVLELAAQKDEREREVRMLGARMELLAAELGYQRRVGIAQTALLVLCLGLVIFSHRGGSSGAGAASVWDIALARNMRGLVRGRSGRARWESPWTSPPHSPPEKGTAERERPDPESPQMRRGRLRLGSPLARLQGPEDESVLGDESVLRDEDALLGDGLDEDLEFRARPDSGLVDGALGAGFEVERPKSAPEIERTLERLEGVD